MRNWGLSASLLVALSWTAFVPEFAHALPAENQQLVTDPLADVLAASPAPPDAALSPEGERKAEALASFAKGLLYEQEADASKMIRAFQRAFDLDPGNSLLAERLAYEYVRYNDVPAAIGVLKDAMAANPREPRLFLHLAMLYSRSLGRHDKGLEYARKALAIAPDNPHVFETLLAISLTSADRGAGRQIVKETLALERAEPAFWIGCAQVAARLLIPGLDPQRAQKKDVELVGKLFDRALEAADGDLDIMLAVADYRQRAGQNPAAIQLLERILESSDAELPLRVAARDRMARALLADGRRDEAIAQLEALIKEAPLQSDAYEFLGQLYEESGMPEQALASYEQVLLLRPKQPMPYLRVADLQVQLGHPERAVAVLEDARRAFPELPQLTYSLAIAYSLANRHELALRTFQLALDEGRTYGEDIATAAFFFNYGVAADKAGRTDLAAANFRKSASLDPQQAAPALNYLGYMLLMRGGDLDEAESAIRRAVTLDPDNAAYLDSLGWLHYLRGDYPEAREVLSKAVRLIDSADPTNYEIYDHLGDVWQKLGDTKRAVENWRQALELAPDNEDIQRKIVEAGALDTAQGGSPDAANAPSPAP